MRIDSSIVRYSPDRSSRLGTAAAPVRETTRELDTRREQPAAASVQDYERIAQARRVAGSSASGDSLPARAQQLAYPSGLNSRAAQAIASYSSTAALASDYDSDAQQVLGLDLYA